MRVDSARSYLFKPQGVDPTLHRGLSNQAFTGETHSKKEAIMASGTILVIEDNEMNMKLVRTLLQMGEYHVLEAMNAERGIELARELKPGLILMDIQLPGMDGLSATRLIKEDSALKDIPIVALTSYAMDGDREKAIQSGCEDYITKPIDTKSFFDKISRFVKPAENGEKEEEQPREVTHKKRILIVDDDPLNVKLLAANLSPAKFEIRIAYDGDEALKKVEEEHPDLILLDVMMPGLDGFGVTARLKDSPGTRDIPIIMVTALNSEDDKARGLDAGADEFLNKPVNAAELKARIRSLLHLKECREQLVTRNESEALLISPEAEEEPAEIAHEPPVILLIENDSEDAALFKAFLQEERVKIRSGKKAEEAVSIAQEERVDLLVLNMPLSEADGLEVCRRMKEMEQTKNIQIMVVTREQDLEFKIKCIESGADDFLLKPVDGEEFKVRVNALVKKKGHLDRLNARVETALHAAITDKLTGLYNHAYFKHMLELEIKRSQRQKHTVGLLMIDIDDFKRINDGLGHPAGDEILRELAKLLQKGIREVDLAARYGGEEFAIILPYSDSQGARHAAERIRTTIATHCFHCRGITAPAEVTVSTGIAFFPYDASNVKVLIQKADKALYRAKRTGKNRVCIYEEAQPE